MNKVQILVTLDSTGKPIKMEARLVGAKGPSCMKHAADLKALTGVQLQRTSDYDSREPPQTSSIRS